MSERGIHYVAADLDESWFLDWTAVGVLELEQYLAKHAAFAAFLGTSEVPELIVAAEPQRVWYRLSTRPPKLRS